MIFTLVEVDEANTKFLHKPLFGAEFTQKVGFEQLKEWRVTKKELPVRGTNAQVVPYLPTKNDFVQEELRRSKLQAKLVQAYMDQCDGLEKQLAFVTNPTSLWSAVKLGKGKCKIFIVGQVARAKPNSKKCILVNFEGQTYTISPWKSLSDFQDPQQNSANVISPFFWVKTSSDEEKVNMEVKFVEVGGTRLPILQNMEIVDAGEQLLRAAEDEISEAPPVAKKAKKTKK